MIKYLKQADIDYDKWDACITKSINSYVYAYSWYLDIVAGEWDALVDDDYQSVFPLPFRSKMGVKYIYQPVFTQVSGVFTSNLQDKNKLQAFLDAIPQDFKLIEININKFYIPTADKNIEVKKNSNIELDMASDYESIYTRYTTNLKRNIKKAKKNELQITKGIKPEQLIKLFKDNKGQEIKAYSEIDYVRLGRLIYTLIHKGMAEIYGTLSSENNLLAAALFVKDSHRHIFLFSGLNEEGKQKSAMPFLIDSFIKKHCESAMILDFEGSNNANLARFYRSFGAEEHSYYGIRKINAKYLIKLGIKLKSL